MVHICRAEELAKLLKQHVLFLLFNALPRVNDMNEELLLLFIVGSNDSDAAIPAELESVLHEVD